MSIAPVNCVYPENPEIGFDLSLVQVEKNTLPEAPRRSLFSWDKAFKIAGNIALSAVSDDNPLKTLAKSIPKSNIGTEMVARSMIFATDLLNPKFGEMGAFLLKSIKYNSSIDEARMAETKNRFAMIGAEFIEITSDDGQKFEMMRITQEAFRKAVHDHGGHFASSGDSELIVGVDKELKTALKKLGWPEVEGGIQFRKYKTLKDGPSGGVIMRIHPYSHLSFFEKKYIINHLALGKDLVTYDTRGHRAGDHLCSEEGIYLDNQAAYQQVRAWGYAPENIWITAKCGGSPSILFLREKFGDDFNMVLENSFLDYPTTTRQNIPIAYGVGCDMLDCMSAKDPETIRAAENNVKEYCDRFNNKQKLEHIAQKNQGREWNSKVVVISAERDLSVEKEAGRELARLSAQVSSATYHLVHGLPENQKDGHRDEALVMDAKIFNVYSQIVTDGQQIVELNSA